MADRTIYNLENKVVPVSTDEIEIQETTDGLSKKTTLGVLPVSTPVQTILDEKANLAGGNTITGDQDITGNVTIDGYVSWTKTGVFASLSAPADTTIITAGTYYPINGTFSNTPVENFSAAETYTPGIKYDGTPTMYFEIDWHATVEANVLNTNVSCGISKNGTIFTPSVMTTRCFTAGSPYAFSGTSVVEVAQNNEIQLVVTSDGNGDVITFDNFTTTIRPFFF